MSEKFTLAPEADATLSALGSAELVVGIPALDRVDDTRDAVATARAGLAQGFPGSRAVVIHARCGGQPAEPGELDGVPVVSVNCRAVAGSEPVAPRALVSRAVLEIGQRLGARATALIGAEVSSVTPDWIVRLLDPIMSQAVDFVAPYYQRNAYSGAMISGVVYPLTRALYGKRLRYPLGTEFACSSRLVERHLRRGVQPVQTAPVSVELQLLADAVAGSLPVGQAMLGPRTVIAGNASTDLGAVLLEVLPQVFGEMERTTNLWQKIRGSTPVEIFGSAEEPPADPVAIDRKRLIDAYRLGQQNLREVWGLVHSPGTLVELKKLAQMPESAFSMPDRLWARIIFDFSLAYRTRVMNREHLMGALAPLYLGWLGSLHAEMGEADPARLEDRLEQLCLQYEAEKPYLISRWRWPDRFNP